MAITTQGAPAQANKTVYDSQSHKWRILGAFKSSGIINGFDVVPASPAGMTVRIIDRPDNAAVVKDSSGNWLITTTGDTAIVIQPAPTISQRIDAIVAWRDFTLNSADQTVDGADICGIQVVSGLSGQAPTAQEIASAIPAGANGSFVKLAEITITAGMTTITANFIRKAALAGFNLGAKAIDSANIDFSTITDFNYTFAEQKTNKIDHDGRPVYRKVLNFGALPNATMKQFPTGLTNIRRIVKMDAMANYANGTVLPLPYMGNAANYNVSINFTTNFTILSIETFTDRSQASVYPIIEYTKTI